LRGCPQVPNRDGPVGGADAGPKKSNLSHLELWWRYFALGGDREPAEVEAIMCGALEGTSEDVDVLAAALSKEISSRGGGHPLPDDGDAAGYRDGAISTYGGDEQDRPLGDPGRGWAALGVPIAPAFVRHGCGGIEMPAAKPRASDLAGCSGPTATSLGVTSHLAGAAPVLSPWCRSRLVGCCHPSLQGNAVWLRAPWRRPTLRCPETIRCFDAHVAA
jgi:hypothetical protein